MVTEFWWCKGLFFRLSFSFYIFQAHYQPNASMFRLRLLNETLYVLFSSEVRTLVASLTEILVKGPTHALVNLTLWLQKLTQEEEVKNLCDNVLHPYTFQIDLSTFANNFTKSSHFDNAYFYSFFDVTKSLNNRGGVVFKSLWLKVASKPEHIKFFICGGRRQFAAINPG